MGDKKYFKLCGGLFFNTILLCRRGRISARETRFNGSDGLNEPNILAGLIRVFNPCYEQPSNRSLSTNTTRYKKCSIANGAYLPFDDFAAIEAFNNSVLANYSEPLARMSIFCSKFLERPLRSGRIQVCVNMLLDVIAADESIGLDQKFYVMPDGSPLTKKDLSSISHLYWQPFLLGIWHFIVTNRPNNDIGERTIEEFIDKYRVRVDQPISFRPGFSIMVDSYVSGTDCESGSAESKKANETYDYSDYLLKTKNKYSEIKTLLYNDEPHKFYSFYVCNNIGRKGSLSEASFFPANVMRLTARTGKRIILTGTGGLGKSMMMRHLLLGAIEDYETTKIVPLFIPLKNYTEVCGSIFDYIFSCTSKICDIKKEQLTHSLKYGGIALLLDGLDEIKIELKDEFHNQLEEFIDAFPNVPIIMSSRPFQEFVEYNRFVVLELKPFTKAQALELIDKLEFRPDEPDFKEKFRSELDNKLFDSHREFCTNPLLLTIMLMTFEQFAEIPSKMHIFYREAYLALAQKHDASKGGFKRTLSSGLPVERFSDYLSEFCMRTYHDEKFEFTYAEFVKYFNSLKELKKNPIENVTAQSFLHDLQSGICLLYYEGGKYHFTHRSFQEYFCALFFSKQKDKTLGAIGDFFESRKGRMRGDMTFSMLYDMIPDHVEEYIILPFLEKQIEKCSKENGYWTYLLDNYKSIGYECGITERYYENEPDSFLMNFIVMNLLPNRPGNDVDLPYYEEFVDEIFCLIRYPNGHTECVESGDLDSIDEEKIEILDEEVGFILSAEVDEIIHNKDHFASMIEALNDNNYELKSEYNAILQYYEDLKQKLVPLSDDFFDIF